MSHLSICDGVMDAISECTFDEVDINMKNETGWVNFFIDHQIRESNKGEVLRWSFVHCDVVYTHSS